MRLPTGASIPPVLRRGLVLCGIGIVVLLSLPYMAPGSDTYYAIAWGDRLADGEVPDFSHPPRAKHPLEVLTAAVLSLGGSEFAGTAYVVISVLAFLGLLYAVFRLGRAVWSPLIGVLAVALLVVRPELILYATSAYRDIPFVALVLLAVALAIEDNDRNWPKVFVLLALAGLLRPESWALSGLYGLWLLVQRPGVAGRIPPHPATIVALALAAPIVWTLFDLVFTGDPLDTYRSVGGGSDSSSGLERREPPADQYLRVLDQGIRGLIGWPLAALGAAVAAHSLWRAVSRRSWATKPADPVLVLAAACIALLLAYGGLALFGLDAAPRFLLAPAVALVVLATTLLVVRHVPAVAIALVGATVWMVIALPGDLSAITTTLDEQHDRRERDADLADLASHPRVRDAVARCRVVTVLSVGGPSFTSRGEAIVAPRVNLEPAEIENAYDKVRLGPREALFLFPSGTRPFQNARVHVTRGEWEFVSRC